MRTFCKNVKGVTKGAPGALPSIETFPCTAKLRTNNEQIQIFRLNVN